MIISGGISRGGADEPVNVVTACPHYWQEWNQPRKAATAKPALAPVEILQQLKHVELSPSKAAAPSWAGSWADMRQHFGYK